MQRRGVLIGGLAGLLVPGAGAWAQSAARPGPEVVLKSWYRLVLELVRHTATYSPPVAARAFAYLGATAYEALTKAPGSDRPTLEGQMPHFGFGPATTRTPDPALMLHEAMAKAVATFFGNTGPSGQGAMAQMAASLRPALESGLDAETQRVSRDMGQETADGIWLWSKDDGGAVVENMGFPRQYTPADDPAAWRPTSTISLQQAPLLPDWGKVRPFMGTPGDLCGLPPPPAYSEAPDSPFYKEAREVYDVTRALTDDQKAIARFWSDDPMLSPTPPGHWISIALQIAEERGEDAYQLSQTLALLGMAMADAFIACWDAKFRFNLLRPVTYIQRLVDPAWQPLLQTPPFPEYPSGHSVQSGAAEAVLTHLYGENFAFTDATHVDDGLPARSFPSFRAAAEEAAISRLYGGIHFRAAIDLGLEMGRCVGAQVLRLKTGPRA